MGMIHYVKRLSESIFVHRFSRDTMPLTNIFKNCTFYFIGFGITINLLLSPGYVAPSWTSPTLCYLLLVLFILFEYLNGACHLIQRNLRRPGTTERGIPSGCGFTYVSCANYWWETLCWFTFFLLDGSWMAFVFWGCGLVVMSIWALRRHERY
jgi:very-long-chain enoyl-CoA reductase